MMVTMWDKDGDDDNNNAFNTIGSHCKGAADDFYAETRYVSMSTIVSISMMLTKMILKILKMILNIMMMMMMMMMTTITVVIITRRCRCWMFPSQRCQTTDLDSSVRVQEGSTGYHDYDDHDDDGGDGGS